MIPFLVWGHFFPFSFIRLGVSDFSPVAYFQLRLNSEYINPFVCWRLGVRGAYFHFRTIKGFVNVHKVHIMSVCFVCSATLALLACNTDFSTWLHTCMRFIPQCWLFSCVRVETLFALRCWFRLWMKCYWVLEYHRTLVPRDGIGTTGQVWIGWN